jgi:hypothetical protein
MCCQLNIKLIVPNGSSKNYFKMFYVTMKIKHILLRTITHIYLNKELLPCASHLKLTSARFKGATLIFGSARALTTGFLDIT